MCAKIYGMSLLAGKMHVRKWGQFLEEGSGLREMRDLNGVLGHDCELVRLYWTGENLG